MSNYGFVPHGSEDLSEMLKTVGVKSVEDLYAAIPEELRIKKLDLPEGISEYEVAKRLHELSKRNDSNLVCFMGGGFYDHFIPAAADAIASRGEFTTCYTPYQPEVAQGTLQTMFEYQSGMCRLTGLEVSNASVYDGGSAVFEAAAMSYRVTGRRRFLVDGTINPIYRNMLESYAANMNFEFCEVPGKDGKADKEAIKAALDKTVAAVILQNPSFFGCVDDYTDTAAAAHEAGALCVMICYPLSLAYLKTPGEMGVDIAVGDAQSLGLPLGFGGPYLGFMVTTLKLARKMPGRICGETHDKDGNRGFVLTLQAREQHIRREKATSNICSNQNLCAITATIYLALMGKEGLYEAAESSAKNAAYALDKLTSIPGVSATFSSPIFNEFAVTLPCCAGKVCEKLLEKGFAGGIPLGRFFEGMGNVLLVACTEKRTKAEIDAFAEALKSAIEEVK